jgi:hypothetical protein
MGCGEIHPLRAWREEQVPRMTLDAAAAGVGTTRQTWYDWESGRRIPDRRYMPRLYSLTRGAVVPNDFYELPPLGQMTLPFAVPDAPLLDHANAAVGDSDNEAAGNEHGGSAAAPLQVAA